MLNTLRRLPKSPGAKAFASILPASSNIDVNPNSGLFAILTAATAATAVLVGNDKADCTAIAAVVGKENFDAR